jgi:hypothetical protein
MWNAFGVGAIVLLVFLFDRYLPVPVLPLVKVESTETTAQVLLIWSAHVRQLLIVDISSVNS